MVPISSPEAREQLLDPRDRAWLLELARDSIANGLNHGSALKLDPSEIPEPLREKRAAFVTLHRGGSLRGCIGHLEAVQSMAQDVADNAYAAAFSDPRFPPLSRSELDDLEIHVSLLTQAKEMKFVSEADLIDKLRPGIDGLILEEGYQRGTFLPSVWESLTDPREFLQHLKQKAGLPTNHWSDKIRVYRYTTESFAEAELV